ncbi:MAG: domain containing protein [Chlorobi bacterium]|nr:domain containing protein [Chlorobiota bacterium]
MMHNPTPSLGRLAILVTTIMLSAFHQHLHAQKPIPPLDSATAGRTYILAYPDTVANKLDSRFPNNKVKEGFSLFLYSATPNNNVKITSAGGVNIVTLDAGAFREFVVKSPKMVVAISNVVQTNVITVNADNPIIVYCYFATKQSCEAWTPIPVELWGKEYNVAGAAGDIVNDIGIAGETALPLYPKAAPAEAMIIAAYDSTRVIINTHGRQLEGNPPLNVTLNRNEVYQFQSWCDTSSGKVIRQVDLSGVSIVGDKPIGVLSGNTRNLVEQSEPGLGNNIYKNMLMEWLAPMDARGTEFAYLPTWDGMQSDSAHQGLRKLEYVQVVGNSTHETGGAYTSASFSGSRPVLVPIDTTQRIEFGGGVAGYIRTTSPAQVMLLSNSITRFNGSTPCFQGLPCLSYSGWAPYMTEITPREQWTSFAPCMAPSYPVNIISYINVVADTNSAANITMEDGSRFLFTRKIPGTDLIWGSMRIAPGATHYLVGSNGARFGGYAYGIFAGSEDYRPGRTRKDEEDGSILGGPREGTALHPCEYEEYSALSYGYPLAPRRSSIHISNDLKIDTAAGCSRFSISIHSSGSPAVGIASVRLEDSSTVNARLVAVTPSDLKDLPQQPNADLLILPVNDAADTKGAVIITDQMGRSRRIAFSFYRQIGLVYDRSAVDFGYVGFHQSGEITVMITNNGSRDIAMNDIHAALHPDIFHVVSSIPPLVPTPVLKSGKRMYVTLGVTAPAMDAAYIDTLRVGCETAGIAMTAHGTIQRIHVTDPAFGFQDNIVDGRKPVVGAFHICNEGKLPITLQRPDSLDVIQISDTTGTFTIAPLTMKSLQGKVLAPGECRTVEVTFRNSKEGTYHTVARVWASTRDYRDTSVWNVIVSSDAAAPMGASAGYAFDEALPNPFRDRTEFRFALGAAGVTTVEVYDAVGTRVATLADGWLERGPHAVVWDAAGMPVGIYHCRIGSGIWSADRTVILQK